jgi:hypothetical protein
MLLTRLSPLLSYALGFRIPPDFRSKPKRYDEDCAGSQCGELVDKADLVYTTSLRVFDTSASFTTVLAYD